MPNGAGLAAGGGPQGSPAQSTQVAPGQAPQMGNAEQVMEALKQAIMNAVDEQGFVDISKLAQIWPQIAQQMGIDIPFETVIQYVQSNPQILMSVVQELGLAGIISDGRQIGAEELSGMGSGAAGAGGVAPPSGGVAPQGGGIPNA